MQQYGYTQGMKKWIYSEQQIDGTATAEQVEEMIKQESAWKEIKKLE